MTDKKTTETKTIKKRSLNDVKKKRQSVDDLLSSNLSSNINSSENENNHSYENRDKKSEIARMSDVSLNYKNKRVITQFLRFIPDSMLEEDYPEDDAESHIIKNISRVPLNNIIKEITKAQDGGEGVDKDILNYPNHSDMYDTVNEGVFIGKGICFHNVHTENIDLLSILDDFVERVTLNGESLEENGELTESPQIMKTGGQKYRLVFGTQRYCYITYAYGTLHMYEYIMSMSNQEQDLKIYLENNTKTSEYGYEKLLSYHFTVKALDGKSLEDTLRSISRKKAYYYQIKPFIDDIELINLIKKYRIKLSIKDATDKIKEVKAALKIIGAKDKESLYESFKNAIKIPVKAEKTTNGPEDVILKTDKPKVNKVKLNIPPADIEKLLFSDVRSWSKLDLSAYDLTDESGVKKYLNALTKELFLEE